MAKEIHGQSNSATQAGENTLPYHLLSPEAKKKFDEKKFIAEAAALVNYEFIRIHIALQAKYQNEIDNLKKQLQENKQQSSTEWSRVQLVIDKNNRMDVEQYHKFQQAQTKFDLAIKIIDFRIEEIQKFIVKKEEELEKLTHKIDIAKQDLAKNWLKMVEGLGNNPQLKSIKAQVYIPGNEKPINLEMESYKQLQLIERMGRDLKNGASVVDCIFSTRKDVKDDLVLQMGVHFPANQRRAQAEEFIRENNLVDYFANSLMSRILKDSKINNDFKNICNMEKDKAKLELKINAAKVQLNHLNENKQEVINNYNKNMENINIAMREMSTDINQSLNSMDEFTNNALNDSNNIKVNLENEFEKIQEIENRADNAISDLEKIASIFNDNHINPQEITKELNDIHQKVEDLNPEAYERREVKPETVSVAVENTMEEEQKVELDSSLRNK